MNEARVGRLVGAVKRALEMTDPGGGSFVAESQRGAEAREILSGALAEFWREAAVDHIVGEVYRRIAVHRLSPAEAVRTAFEGRTLEDETLIEAAVEIARVFNLRPDYVCLWAGLDRGLGGPQAIPRVRAGLENARAGSEGRYCAVVRLADFSRDPGGEKRRGGKDSGQEWYEDHLRGYFDGRSEGRIKVDVSTPYGLASSFIKGSFGALAREVGSGAVLSRMEIVCDDDPLLVEMIVKVMQEEGGASDAETLGVL